MKRRTILNLAVSASAAAGLLGPTAARATDAKTFVLLHGAFHGGWCWSPVAERLRAEGHRVFTPTFTGVGERAHLLNPTVDLNTFIQDVIAVVEMEELQRITLVAHSFGGYVASGVIDRIPGRIASAIYLDAPMGSNGVSVLGEAPADVRQARLAAAVDLNGTRAIAPPSSTAFGLSEAAQVAWVNRRMTPMPLRAYETPLTLKGPPGGGQPKRFIRCVEPALPNIEASGRYAREHGWRYSELRTGHDAMISMPTQVAEMLLVD
ncbi:alpha/beta hydrolase family protein [Acidovorax sp. Root402]|jgi:pimeloyl-ACP methyl ester carboxylesterase|uniref:alpha/beta hydrolase n=1 Tax=Acidovorax sp. Root402 TaxID=1736527 RepID=UPI0009E780C9|nr:alpha/beta hydrolase family protein [Acidovorax sp. Root402]